MSDERIPAVWLRTDGVGPDARLRVLVKTSTGWRVVIDEWKPHGDGLYEICAHERAATDAPLDPITEGQCDPRGDHRG